MIAMAALVYGFLERRSSSGRGSGSVAGAGQEASPWRMVGAVGAGGVIGTGADGGAGRRTSTSQYESISDVSSSLRV